MFGKLAVAVIALSLVKSACAIGTSGPIVMTGITQMADTAELRFDPAPADTGTLVILGDHSKTPQQTYRFVYNRLAPYGTVDPEVSISFADKHTLTILCDALSDNCRSTDYVTEGAATFSMMWKLTRR
ncbi:hypothetical protein [Paraburkholderia sp.]|uniref:hypothetical protein n=1 Tax=Paraburkholderia sp. TaxID=1926495 RepID=UPI002F41D5C4